MIFTIVIYSPISPPTLVLKTVVLGKTLQSNEHKFSNSQTDFVLYFFLPEQRYIHSVFFNGTETKVWLNLTKLPLTEINNQYLIFFIDLNSLVSEKKTVFNILGMPQIPVFP